MHISSYPSVYAIGHRSIADLFSGTVEITEKVDGSQWSMTLTEAGELCCRSKGKDIILDAPEKMFIKAIESAKSLPLHPGWVYRCEYLEKPKHNVLAYDRVPAKHLILFNVMTGPETYLSYPDMVMEAARLGLDVVPLLYSGTVDSREQFAGFLERESVLGGCKIEGVVVKNYAVFTQDKKIAVGKYVSEAFKEKHNAAWRVMNPGKREVVDQLITSLKTEARWRKAIQHLKESGVDTETPQCIGAFIKEIQADVLKEEGDQIKETLFKHFWPQIARGIIGGAPEWFKEQLTQSAFTKPETIAA
jgi:hypothetical protein